MLLIKSLRIELKWLQIDAATQAYEEICASLRKHEYAIKTFKHNAVRPHHLASSIFSFAKNVQLYVGDRDPAPHHEQFTMIHISLSPGLNG